MIFPCEKHPLIFHDFWYLPYKCKRDQIPPFSHGCHMISTIFLWFSYDFTDVNLKVSPIFLWFFHIVSRFYQLSYGFPMGVPLFSYGFFLWFSYVPMIFPWFSIFLWFSYGCPIHRRTFAPKALEILQVRRVFGLVLQPHDVEAAVAIVLLQLHLLRHRWHHQEIMGKPLGNHGKSMGKAWENHRKMEKSKVKP